MVYELLRALEMTDEAMNKPPLHPKSTSSDEMPETPEERADRKDREAALDHPSPGKGAPCSEWERQLDCCSACPSFKGGTCQKKSGGPVDEN